MSAPLRPFTREQGTAATARRPLVTLTATECGVLSDAASGLTVAQSAAHRAKSIETIKTQRRSVLYKLGARNMPHAVAIGVLERLIATGRHA